MTAKNRRPKGEGTIFQKADGRWVGRLTYDDPGTGLRKRSQVSADTKRAASIALRKLRERVEAGAPPRDDSATFGAYAAEWIVTTLEASERKGSTKTLYGGLARTHVVPSALGGTSLAKLTAAGVERFITELRKKDLSPSTVRQVYTVGRAIADTAVRDRMLSANPFAQVKRPKATSAEAAHLTPAELDQLLEAAASTRYDLLFRLLANTGLRRGEAMALRWQDVNLTDSPRDRPKVPARSLRVRGTLARQGGELVVTEPKSARSYRTVPLTVEAVDVLAKVRTRTATERLRAGSKWSDSGFVFVTEFGEASDPRNALRALQSSAAKAGLERVGLHTLRHTAATTMLNNGAPVTVVSRLLGHSSIQITVDTYGHDDDEAARAALEVLATGLSRKPAG